MERKITSYKARGKIGKKQKNLKEERKNNRKDGNKYMKEGRQE